MSHLLSQMPEKKLPTDLKNAKQKKKRKKQQQQQEHQSRHLTQKRKVRRGFFVHRYTFHDKTANIQKEK